MRKPGRNRRFYRRVIVVFLFAIMLPSFFQAYLGLRYLKQEEKRQEELVLRSLKVTLSGAAGYVEENLERTINKVVDSIAVQACSREGISPFHLQNFLNGYNFLQDVFILDNKGQLKFPRTFRSQKKVGESGPGVSEIAMSWLVNGEKSEADRNYGDAISKYSAGLNYCRHTSEKQAFRIRIARCQLKSGDLNGAKQNYLKILSEDSDHFYGEEIPYRFIATFQLVQIMDRLQQESEAFNILVSLYETMLDNFEQFPQNQFAYYLSRVKEDLGRHQDKAGTVAQIVLDSLMQLEMIYMHEPARADRFNNAIIPPIKIVLLSGQESSIVHYTSIKDTQDSTIIIAYLDLGYQSQGARVIGAELNRDQILDLAEKSLGGMDMGENLKLVLMKSDKDTLKTIGGDESPIAEQLFPLLAGTVTGLKLGLIGMYGTSIKEYTARAVTMYYAIIFTIIIIIALGVFFIFQDLSRENELMQMKSDLISNVSHDLKTPISTIRTLAENVSEGWVTSMEKQHEYFQLIARESERLGHLVENTLDFSRIESGSKKYFMEAASLQDVIEKTVERFKIMMEGEEFSIYCSHDDNLPAVCIDKMAIGQAILNLLDNAVKYSPEEKFVSIDSRQDGNYIKIAVTDRGIGIEKKDIPMIFNKFYRSESATGVNRMGSGIGLTLVKEIVNAHKGEVSVESKVSVGSTFTLSIPINQNI